MLVGCSRPAPLTSRPPSFAFEDSTGTVASVRGMALVTSDGASATVIAAGDDIVTVGWSGAGGSSMLTVDFAEDGTAAIRQWITAHPRGLLRLTFEGSTLGTVAVSPELRRGAVTVGGSAVSTRKRKIESATKHSGFGPHGSA